MSNFITHYPHPSPSPAGLGGVGIDSPISDELKRQDLVLLPFEKRMIEFAVEGYSTGEAAQELGISEPRLTEELIDLFDKLHVSNLFELILFAMDHQLAESQDCSAPRQPALIPE